MISFKNLLMTAVLLLAAGAAARSPGAPAPGHPLVDEARAASGAPGMAAAVITSDRIEVFASGVRRGDRPAVVERGDAFHIGSDLKAMVATLIAQEIEHGRLRWDSTIEEILPDVAIHARREYRRVTISQLLQHRGGVIPMLTLDDLRAVPKLRGPIVEQRVEFARWVLRRKPIHAPGTRAEYSNAGYLVAAAMLERVTRRSTEHLLERRLFAPLGITSAQFGWPAARDRHAPWGHAYADGVFVPADPRDPANLPPEWANAAGNLSLSTRDFARFVQLHLRGLRGTSTFLDPATFRQLHAAVDGYGCGWGVIETEGPTVSWHAGGTGLFYAVMVLVPALDRAAVVVVNADTEALPAVAFGLANQLLAAQ